MEIATSNGMAVNQKSALLSALSLAKGHRNEEETVEGRSFLGALTAASVGGLSEGSFIEFARAQNTAEGDTTSGGQSPFETSQVEVSGNRVFLRRYGNGPAILMVHGFPRTSLMWRFVAPKLAENHTVICVDLRAYGHSGIPASTDDHFPYSKRAMAKELVDVMAKLGFPTFTLIGHDRGGRVSYRMALDYPKNVERLAVFDVIPILEGWSRSDARFAQNFSSSASISVSNVCNREVRAAPRSQIFSEPISRKVGSWESLSASLRSS